MTMIPGTRPPAGWEVEAADIHVWTLQLDVSPAVLGACRAVLCSTELERARKFHFDQHRNRFIAGRGRMRMLLGRYLRSEPARLEFACGPFGKPFLSDGELNFNLAHSEDLALLAVTRAGLIGVDIERIRPLTDAGQLAARFFSARESAALDKLPPEEKPAAFFNLWTRKEAWLKATGEGIGHLLNAVEPSFLPGEPARFISLPADAAAGPPWILQELEPSPGFVAALAVRTQMSSLTCYWWNAENTTKAEP